MSQEEANVLSQDDVLKVSRNSDQKIFRFKRRGLNWLLVDNDTDSSLLFGTRFVGKND